jgi:hypothetical protein
MSSATADFPSFSSADNPQMRFRQYLNRLLEQAANHSSRVDGLTGYLLPPAEFLTKFGHAYQFPAERQDEPVPSPARASVWQAWKHHEEERKQVRIELQAFRLKFIAGLDEPTLQLFEDADGGNLSRTLEWMVSRMREEYGTVTAAQLETFEQQLNTPFIIGDSMQAYITRHRHVHQTYVGLAQPMQETLKVRHLLNGLRPSGRFFYLHRHIFSTLSFHCPTNFCQPQ